MYYWSIMFNFRASISRFVVPARRQSSPGSNSRLLACRKRTMWTSKCRTLRRRRRPSSPGRKSNTRRSASTRRPSTMSATSSWTTGRGWRRWCYGRRRRTRQPDWWPRRGSRTPRRRRRMRGATTGTGSATARFLSSIASALSTSPGNSPSSSRESRSR